MSLKMPEWRGKSAFFDDDILQQIYLLMSNASERITFVAPYIGLWEHFKSKLGEASRRKIEISFLTRDSEEERVPRKRPIQDLARLKAHGVDVIEVPNLHAKIYMNERTVLLSSMNITLPSIANSHEFAFMLRSEMDA